MGNRTNYTSNHCHNTSACYKCHITLPRPLTICFNICAIHLLTLFLTMSQYNYGQKKVQQSLSCITFMTRSAVLSFDLMQSFRHKHPVIKISWVDFVNSIMGNSISVEMGPTPWSSICSHFWVLAFSFHEAHFSMSYQNQTNQISARCPVLFLRYGSVHLDRHGQDNHCKFNEKTWLFSLKHAHWCNVDSLNLFLLYH